MRGSKPFATVLWLAGAVLVTAVLYVGARIATDYTPFSIQKIDIRGTVRTGNEALMETLGLSTGMSFFDANVEELTNRAKALPWVRDAKVSRRIPDAVNIEIEEWDPAFIVRLDRLYYMTRDGHVINAPLTIGMDYPVVTGMTWNRLEGSGADRAKLLAALEAVAQGSAGDRVDEVHYDQALGITVYAAGAKPYGAFMGFGDMEDKFARLGRMRKTLQKKGQYAVSADLSHDDRIVARLMPLPPPGEQVGVR